MGNITYRLLFILFLSSFWSKSAIAQTTTQTFNYTGGNQTFVVPACVNSITVQAWGAGGASGGGDTYSGSEGGGGAYSTSVLSVTPGSSLTIIVGGGGVQGGACQAGSGAGAGGFGLGNGGSGGNPGTSGCSGPGGGGGGGTGIMNGASILIVAGGGGGGGGGGNNGGGSQGGGGGQAGISGGSSAANGILGQSGSTVGLNGSNAGGADGAGGGGGGGGLVGGGGGHTPPTDNGGSGGAGGTSLGTTVNNGNAQTPGNAGALAGICAACSGGASSAVGNAAGNPGGNGVLVISYNNPVPPTGIITTGAGTCGVTSATVTPSGGTPAFTYTWSPLGGNAATTNLTTAGNYTVVFTDATGCVGTATTNIVVPPGLNMSLTGPVNPYCDTTKLDWVTWASITATGGTGSVSSNLSISLTKPTGGLFTTPSLFASGNFPVQYNLPANNTTLGNTLAGVFTFCFNKPVIDPQVAFSSIGQAGISVPIVTSVPYSVIWPGINMSYPSNTTLIGTEGYTIIQFPGQHTCISFDYLASENYCNLVFGIRDTNCQTTPICKGSPATFTASGAVSYTWSPSLGASQTTGSIVSLNPPSNQTYMVIGTDGNGCKDTAITSIKVNSAPVPTITSFTNVTCFGLNNGSILAGVTQGTAPYHYLWTNGNTTTMDSPLAPGTYSLTVTDTNGCKGTVSQVITETAVLKDSISAFSNLSCFGIPNGSATVGVRGGTIPYSYAWNTTPAQSTATASALPMGSYTVTVNDANLCSTTATVTITQPPALTLTAITTDVDCKGLSTGSATATVSGVTGPTYTVGIISPPQGGITLGTQILAGLAAGSYTVGAQDVNSCQIIFPITITEPTLLVASISSSKNDSCFGTSIGNAATNVVGGTAPYTYLWNTIPAQSTPTANNLPAGTYTATVTDAHLCKDTAVVTITQPPAFIASITSFKNDSCFGTSNGNAAVGVVGGTSPYLYAWTTTPVQSNSTAINLTAGSYSVNVTDAQGCLASTTVTISQPAVLTLTATATNVTCNGLATGSATATATGGTSPYTYGWNFPPQQISLTGIASGFTAGTYTAGVQDFNGCLAAVLVPITEPGVLVASITSSKNDSCFGDSNGNAIVNAIGGTSPYTYLWNTVPSQATPTASNLPAGTYTALITDAQACMDTAVVTITQPAVLIASITSSKNDSCFGDSNGNAIAGAMGGTTPYLYSWNTTPVQLTSTASNLAAAGYTATVTDIKGCITTTTISITQPAVLTVSSVPKTICISQATTLTANVIGGTTNYSYLWNATAGTQTNSVNPITTTTYSVKVIDSKGCKDSNTVTVFVRDSLKFLAVSPGAEKCKGFTTNLNATGFGGDSLFTYTWVSNTGSMSGQSVNVSPPVTTTYTLILKDGCNTPSIDTTITVIIDPLPQISFSSDKQNGCYPLCVAFTNSTTISSTDTIKYNWNLGGTNSSYASTAITPTHCYKASGVFTVSLTATSGKGCIAKSYISNMITAYPHPKAKFYSSPDAPNILSPLVQFTDASYAPGSGISSVFWQTFGDATDSTSTLPNPQHTYRDTGTYCPTLIVTNTFGCKDTLTQCLVIEPYFTLYIPNAFSPNGDGYNDNFNVVGDYIFDFEMRIFDRWGNLVYHSTNVKNGWNGSMKGVSAAEDVYVYLINATDYYNKSYSYKGTVTLIK